MSCPQSADTNRRIVMRRPVSSIGRVWNRSETVRCKGWRAGSFSRRSLIGNMRYQRTTDRDVNLSTIRFVCQRVKNEKTDADYLPDTLPSFSTITFRTKSSVCLASARCPSTLSRCRYGRPLAISSARSSRYFATRVFFVLV